jgi:hypothetical protein
MLFYRFAYFISVFIRVFIFVHISDRFACYSREIIITFSFLLVFWFLLLLESYIHLDCTAKLVLFGVGFSSARIARR